MKENNFYFEEGMLLIQQLSDGLNIRFLHYLDDEEVDDSFLWADAGAVVLANQLYELFKKYPVMDLKMKVVSVDDSIELAYIDTLRSEVKLSELFYHFKPGYTYHIWLGRPIEYADNYTLISNTFKTAYIYDSQDKTDVVELIESIQSILKEFNLLLVDLTLLNGEDSLWIKK